MTNNRVRAFSRMPAYTAAVAAIFAVSGTAAAQSYTFTSAIDSTMSTGLGSMSSFAADYGISGTTLVTRANSGSTQGIFTGSGGAIATIVKVGDAAASGTYGSFGLPAISGTTVSFRGTNAAGTATYIINSTAGVQTTIISTTSAAPVGNFTAFSPPKSSSSLVAFQGTYSGTTTGVFSKAGATLTTIAKVGDTGPGSFGQYTNVGSLQTVSGINVAFQASSASVNFANFLWTGSSNALIVKTGDTVAGIGTLFDVGSPAVSGTTIAFKGFASGNGILKGTTGGLVLLAKTGDASPIGVLTDFDNKVSIAGSSVLFTGTSASGRALFLNDGTTTSTVLKTGDALFGSTVTSLNTVMSNAALESSGMFAFNYTLANSVTGIATGIVAVPEPGSILAVSGGLMALLWPFRRKSSTRAIPLGVAP